jgi:hypothetical protein
MNDENLNFLHTNSWLFRLDIPTINLATWKVDTKLRVCYGDTAAGPVPALFAEDIQASSPFMVYIYYMSLFYIIRHYIMVYYIIVNYITVNYTILHYIVSYFRFYIVLY